MKSTTKASTTCGGCAALVTQILNKEMARLGFTVKKDICEHFPHSRQELYHIVRVERCKTFEELLDKHGRGRGCDICKPAVASILAACWNHYVLRKEHAGLQDTNDHYLANMQKDGTYSVIPRVAGGEITPRSSSRSDGWRSSTGFTPRSRARSASTCSGRASISCHTSGRTGCRGF